MPTLPFKKLAVVAARGADDKKGENIALYYVGPTHPLADYLLIVTALAPQHMESLEAAIRKATDAVGLRALRCAGSNSKLWRVLDYGELLVHLMTAQTRVFYALDKLYVGARRLNWQAPSPHKIGLS